MNTQKILESLFKQALNENEGSNQKSARQSVRAFFQNPNMPIDKINAILQLVQTKVTNAKLLDKFYLKGATRIFLELTNGNFTQIDYSTNRKISQLNQYIGIIANAHKNEYDKDLNGLHYEDLDNKFKTEAFQKSEKERTESLNKQFQGGSDYQIVRIPDYETASKYARYTSWCVCHNNYAYEQYTNGGTGLFYFCLKNGFENIPKRQGKNNPLDEYGLSMIAVSVDMDGNPTTITCRWNHDFGANDHIITPQQLENVINRSFYGTFKPYSKQELRAKGIVLFEDVPGLLAKGVPPEKIFNTIRVLQTDGGFSYRIVTLNHKYNVLTSDNKLLFNKWFKYLGYFNEGFAAVQRSEELWNFIDKNGNILSNEWFIDVDDFNDGFAKVQREDALCNFIDRKGNILSNEWFNNAYSFYEGFAKVKRSNGIWYKIDKNGNLYTFKGNLIKQTSNNQLNENKKIQLTKVISRKQILNENEGSNQRSARQGVRAFFQNKNMSVDKINAILQLVQTKVTNAKLLDKFYLKGATRIFLELTDGNFTQLDPSTTMKFNKLSQYIGIIANAHKNEYDKDLNGLHYEQLDNKFKTEAIQNSEKERTESLNKQFQGGSDYQIVRIPDYETASKYARYTSWCVCHSDYAYDQYTNGGSGLFYFCLKNGFENVPKTQGENNPLDEYGLSMIAVSVDMDGNPTTITCRWNHDFEANDHVMTPQQLEKVINRSFYGTFKPYSKQELRAKGIIFFEEVPGLLAKGVQPEKIFSEISYPHTDGGFSYRRVKLNKKYNVLTSDNKLLFNKWFNYLGDFHNGFARVQREDGLWNFIDKNGNYLSNEWFNFVGDFIEGFAGVQREDLLWNFIDRQGNILSDEWFKDVNNFYKGFAAVQRTNGEWYKIDKDGNLYNKDGKLIKN